jgi:spore coat protein CotH
MRRPTATIARLLALSVIPTMGSAQTSDELFNGQILPRVDLRLHSADWEKLKAEFLDNTYYPADLTWNSVTVRNVGIRSRGHGSRSGNKPGLRVDFDRYATDQCSIT